MIVKMAILSTTGTALFEVDAPNIEEAREKLRKGDAVLLEQGIERILYNFETLEEVKDSPLLTPPQQY